MKNIVLIFITSFCPFLSFSQEIWSRLSINSTIVNNPQLYDIEIINGKVYQFSHWYNGSDVIQVDKYNAEIEYWDPINTVNTTALSKIATEKIGNDIYIAAYDNTDFHFYKFDLNTSSFSTLSAPYNFPGANDNWKFHAGKNANELYVLFTSGTGPSDVHGLEYNSLSGDWTYISESSSSQNLAIADLQIQSSETDVYFGVFSNKLRITRFVKGNISVMYAHDGLLGEINSNGSLWDNRGFVLSGNKTDLPSLYATEDANNLTYEVPIDGNSIDINWSDPTTGYNLSADFLAKESGGNHAYIMSMYSDDGIGNPNDQLYVIKRDVTQGGSLWDTVGTIIEPQGTTLEVNSLKLSLDNNYSHLAASYTINGSSVPEIVVSNSLPYLLAGTGIPNPGLCLGNINEIYSTIELMDDDYDKIRILNAYSLNFVTSNIQVIPSGYTNGISKFKVLGIPSANLDQIVIEYTDGFEYGTLTLDAFQGVTTPANIQFTSNPVTFCSNELQIDLSDRVNYYNEGKFHLNGVDLSNSLINASYLNTVASSGTLRYTVNKDGCFITASANYQIVTPPSVSISSSPSSCSQNSGSATANIIQGTSSTINYYWSTGETTASINNLSPGAYYIHLTDGNNCKATALASIEANEVTLTVDSIASPSCHGYNDGGIYISIGSSSNYRLIWSTGHSTEDLTNIRGGNYEVSYYGADGCQISKTFNVADPAEIKNNFILNRPDCAVSNGSITTNVTGGSGSYSYLWSTSSTSPNLSNIPQGYYEVEITDGSTCILKDSVYLNDNYATIITDSIIPAGCSQNDGGIDVTLIDNPLGGFVNSILWSNGETQEDIFNLEAGYYMITVNSGPNCISQKSYNLGTRPPLKNNICVVSVDLNTSTNLIVWEKAESIGISHYNIYRENAVAGNYMLIDTVQFGSLSVFNDVVASPLQRSWRYRITAVNTCGVEGPYSSNHKTLHLNTINQLTPGVVDIYWDDYEGVGSGQYQVYRYTDQNGWEALVPTIPYGSLTKYTDTPPLGSTGLDYYVDLELQVPCTATLKAQDFNRSRSNKEKGVFNPGSGVGDYSNNNIITIQNENIHLSVYPNPFHEELNINLTGIDRATIEIIDIQGKTQERILCQEGLTNLSTRSLESGIYFIRTNINGQMNTLKIVK